MARTRTTTTSTKPGIMSRLRGIRRNNAVTTSSHSTNPITGTHTTTRKTKSHAGGVGHTGHTGTGTMASHTTTPATHHRRKPSLSDKLSGGLTKLRGSLTRKPGVKAAGTRRMHGTDGRGSHRTY